MITNANIVLKKTKDLKRKISFFSHVVSLSFDMWITKVDSTHPAISMKTAGAVAKGQESMHINSSILIHVSDTSLSNLLTAYGNDSPPERPALAEYCGHSESSTQKMEFRSPFWEQGRGSR